MNSILSISTETPSSSGSGPFGVAFKKVSDDWVILWEATPCRSLPSGDKTPVSQRFSTAFLAASSSDSFLFLPVASKLPQIYCLEKTTVLKDYHDFSGHFKVKIVFHDIWLPLCSGVER